MGFLGGVGKIFSKAWEGVKKVVSGPIGSTLLKMAGSAFGPLGMVGANLVTELIAKKGKLNFGSILSAGLSAFGPLAGKLGSAVQNLPSALKNPSGLLSGLFKGIGIAKDILSGQGTGSLTLSNVVNTILDRTGLRSKLGGILGKATEFLGNVGGFGQKTSGIIETVRGALGEFGIQPPPFVDVFSEKLNSVFNTLNRVNELLGQLGAALNGNNANLIRA